MKNVKKELVDVLHQTNEDDRTVMYWGVAYGVVTTILTKKELSINDVKVAVKDIVNELAELAILDRVLLEKSIINLYSYFNIGKVEVNFSTKLYSSSTMQDALLLNEYIGQATMDTVNNNMPLFTKAARLITKFNADIKECSPMLKG